MTRTQAKLTAAAVLVFISTAVRHYIMMRQFHRGRAGYLAWQAHYFDTALTRHSLITTFIVAVIGTALWLTIYEYLVRLLARPAGRETS